MSNSSCSIASINDLLLNANQNHLNITTTVGSCPGICSLAWGNGNPDLSGIGANISYIFQAVLTVICGPLLCLVYELRHQWNFDERTKKHIASLHNSFLDISAQFSIPVAIAAVIRLRQNAPFYELAFLRSLTTMQFLSLLSTFVTVGLFDEPHRRHRQRIFIIVLYGLLEFGFYMGVIGSLVTNKSSWVSISEFSEACKAYSQIFPWIKYIPSPKKINLPHITAKEYFNPFSKKGWKFSLIITGFVIAGILGLILAALIVIFLFPFLYYALRGKEGARWLVIPMSLAFAIGMLEQLARMENTRAVMKGITGADFQDNQWGFGQVIAVFLWMPLCIQFAYYISQFILVRRKKRQEVPKKDDLERARIPKHDVGEKGTAEASIKKQHSKDQES